MGNKCCKEAETAQTLPSVESIDNLSKVGKKKGKSPKKTKGNDYRSGPSNGKKCDPSGYDEVKVPTPVKAQHVFKNKDKVENALVVKKNENLLVLDDKPNSTGWMRVRRASNNEEGFVPRYVVEGKSNDVAALVKNSIALSTVSIPSVMSQVSQAEDDDDIYENDQIFLPQIKVQQPGYVNQLTKELLVDEDEYVVTADDATASQKLVEEESDSDEGDYVAPDETVIGLENRAFIPEDSPETCHKNDEVQDVAIADNTAADEKEVVAIKDELSTDDRCLSIKKGDLMTIIQTNDNGWLWVTHKSSGKTGYVRQENVDKPETTLSSDKQDVTPFSDEKHVDEEREVVPEEASPIVPESSTASEASQPVEASTEQTYTKGYLVKAIHSHNPQDNGYVTFQKGDTLEVSDKNVWTDNWWEARHKDKGEEGLVPSNFVERINTESSSATTATKTDDVETTAVPVSPDSSDKPPVSLESLKTSIMTPVREVPTPPTIPLSKSPISNSPVAESFKSHQLNDDVPSSPSTAASVSSENEPSAAESSSVKNLANKFQAAPQVKPKPLATKPKPPVFAKARIPTPQTPVSASSTVQESESSNSTTRGKTDESHRLKTAKVLKDYETKFADFLSVKKGDIVEILNDEGAKYEAKSQRTGQKGLVSRSLLSEPEYTTEEVLENFPWFQGKLTRADAEALLKAPPQHQGKFLLRSSDKPTGPFVLSVLGPGNAPTQPLAVRHYVVKSVDGLYFINDSLKFSRIELLIQAHKNSDHGICCKLTDV